MRKLIFFLLLIPAIASLGHDVYFFTQDQSKGFQLSDTGALWDKYHKKSHDQWKNTVKDLSEQIDEVTQNILPQENTPAPTTQNEQQEESYLESFSQTNSKDVNTTISPSPEETVTETNVTTLQKTIGFLLEQKAIIVFGGSAFFFYFITGLLALPFREKSGMQKVQKHKKHARKGGGYSYSRK